MKVLHLVHAWSPDPVGGTEVYVAGLAAALAPLGIVSVVATSGSADAVLEGPPVRVRRYRIEQRPGDTASLYGLANEAGEEAFARMLAAEAPDLVHFHALTPGATPRMAEQAREGGAGVVFTYHTPTVTCPRGTLLRWGRVPCDGALLPQRCAACVLQDHGAPRPLAALAAALARPVSGAVVRSGLSGGVCTAVGMPELLRRRRQALRRFLAAVDRIVVPAAWARDVLVRNGCDAGRIQLSPQGLGEEEAAAGAGLRRPDRPRAGAPMDAGDAHPARVRTEGGEAEGGEAEGTSPPLRVACLGRLHRTKGFLELVRGLSTVPDAPVALDLFAVPSGDGDYAAAVRAAVEAEPRARLLPPVAPAAVTALLRDYDLLTVPSQWLETGPLVVIEARAAGVPILGSALGGIAERVRDGVDGVLVEAFRDPRAWGRALQRLALNRELLAGYAAAAPATRRTMAHVADEMALLYRALSRAGS